MKFGMNPAPYYRNKRSTTQIMIELLIGLGVVWACAIVYYFLQGGTNGIFAIVNPLITTLTCVLTEVLFMLPKHIANKEDFNSLLNKVINSYGYVTGLILGLLLPVGTSIYVLIITAVFTAAIGKMVFGGFGHNIFNPAIVGRIFAQTAFNSSLKYDTALSTGATLTTNMGNYGWSLDIIGEAPGQTSLLDVLLGNYRGTLGETFTIVILIVGIVLMIRKVIDWRITVTYLVTIFLASVGMGLVGGYGLDAFEYGLVQISLGGVMFGAVFCLTDPVTSPTSPAGKIIFAVGCGLFTVLIRFFGSAPEGVAYSILIMNMLTPLIDSTIKGLTTENQLPNIVTASVITALTITAGCVSGTQVDKLQFANYLNSGLSDSKALSSQVKYVGEEGGNEIYNVVVAGNLKENYSKKLGNVTSLFRSELEKHDKYFKDAKYQDAKYVADGKVLQISYKENGEKKTINALTLATGKGDGKTIGKDIHVVKAGKTVISTGVSSDNEPYKTVYGVSIDESLNVIVTFASDHSTSDETNVAFASVDVDVTINFEEQLIISTKLNSYGAGGGYGDAMFENDKDKFAEPHDGYGGFTEEQVNACLAFYAKYVQVTTPLKFKDVVGLSSGSVSKKGDSLLNLGCTFTTNGYMFALESVVEYAFAYHNYENVGRVGVLDYGKLR